MKTLFLLSLLSIFALTLNIKVHAGESLEDAIAEKITKLGKPLFHPNNEEARSTKYSLILEELKELSGKKSLSSAEQSYIILHLKDLANLIESDEELAEIGDLFATIIESPASYNATLKACLAVGTAEREWANNLIWESGFYAEWQDKENECNALLQAMKKAEAK